MNPLRSFINIIRFVTGAIRLLILTVSLLVRAVVLVIQLVQALRTLRHGLVCPRGHPVPTDGSVYSCASCGFTWEGSTSLLCPNPECKAGTPYLSCPTCSLSVPNPYRLHP
jgi:hypothetical protein